MEKQPTGSTLLVGEGDFSFTVALTHKLLTGSQGYILATSLETPQSIKKHVTVEHNISVLKQKGVEVRLSTDATQLHTDPFFKDNIYSRIIFNFPHAGGKSNLKKNRKLLNDFFASACHVLEPKGHIMVTLCKGQGGTPADQPIRKWCDSWQIVSMAANSGLILVKILPFSDEAYTVYTSTGFRSQDKRFHTDRAITHVFERAESVIIPDKVVEVTIRVGEQLFTCPAYVYHKLKQIRMINKQKQHVIQRFYRSVVSRLKQYFKIEFGIAPDVTIRDENLQTCLFAHPVYKAERKQNVNSRCSDSVNHVYTLKLTDDIRNPAEDLGDLIHLCGNVASEKDGRITEYYLSGSFVDSLDSLPSAFKEEDCFITSGAMFNRVPISPVNIPSFFSLFISCPVSHDLLQRPCDTSKMSGSSNMQTTKQTYAPKESKLIEQFGPNLHLLISKTLQVIRAIVPDPDKVDITVTEEVARDCQYGTLYSIGTIVGKICLDGQKTMSEIGQVYLAELKQTTSTKSWKIMIEIYLCTLICSNLKIPSEKYVWSNDYRVMGELDRVMQRFETGELVKGFGDEDKIRTGNESVSVMNKSPGIEQEEKKEIQLDKKSKITEDDSWVISSKTDGKNKDLNERLHDMSLRHESENIFNAPSLYPLTSVHDMSFWENENLLFDESEFHEIIRSVAGDEVISAELIDLFTDPTTGKRSRCYRLTFRSIDKCLSYNCSWKLQSLIRLEVARHMKIILR